MAEMLVRLFQTTLQPDLAARRAAEEELGRAKVQPECVLTVLQILSQEAVDLAIRQAASIFFKNLVKAHWEPDDETAYTIPDATKTQCKDGLLSLFLVVPPKLQAQLSEAMSLIASHDFPERWPTLLGQLVGQLGAAAGTTPRDYAKVGGLLKIFHSITGRYRHEFKSDALYAEIKTVLEAFQAPLLELAKLTASELPAADAAGKAAVVPLLNALTLIAKLFYDLTAQDLPEYFEDKLTEWMGIFTTLLRYSNAEITGAMDDEDTEPSPISCLQAELVDCLALLMSKEEEAFQPFLSEALSTVWTLLMATGLAPHQDLLVTTAIRFLTTVATSPHHQLFASADVLQNVCEKIIAPNVQLLTQDEEIFEDNPFEYIRRDAEGSDTDTRRRVSCDLVRALCRNYEAQTTTLFSGYAAASADAWKAKDAAIYIVIALTLRGSTAKQGATQTNTLVNLTDFFASTVSPILQAGASTNPILLADALKFVTVFRGQLPAEAYALPRIQLPITSLMASLMASYGLRQPALPRIEPRSRPAGEAETARRLSPAAFAVGLPLCPRPPSAVPGVCACRYTAVFPLFGGLLSHKQIVVHTYAAIGIERLLTFREPAPAGTPAGTPPPLRFGAAQLTPLLQPLLQGLFGALKLAGSTENAYVMRAILRVAVVAGEQMGPYVTVCVDELKGHLTRVCENPSNPSFNHYMFEAIAALVRSLCDKSSPTSAQAVDAFEAMLFPPFQHVLQKDVSEFTPYVFQILAQLLECRSALSQAYLALFPPLLAPTMWERPANTPALVRLLCAYLAVGKPTVAPSLEKVLGVFQKLLSSKASDAFACSLLSAIWRSFELAELAAMVTPIFTLCLTRLQSNKKVAPALIGTWCVFVGRYGAAALRGQMEAIQPGLLAMLLRGVWAESLNSVPGVVGRKTAAIGTARVLTECAEVAADTATFGPALQALMLMLLQDQGMPTAAPAVTLAASTEEMTETADIDNTTEGGGVGYVAAYVGLSFASAAEDADLYPGESASGYAVKALSGLHARANTLLPSVVGPMMAALPAEKQAGVQALLAGVC